MQKGLFEGSDDYNRGFRGIVIALISLVIVPTALLLVVGMVMLVFYDVGTNLVFGLLVVTLVACLITGTVLSLVLLRREANLSRLQLDFVSKVSHELRTPLTSIRMFAETLRYENDTKQISTCLDMLQVETERLSERIERLLDWGRMEAGRRVYERVPDSVPAIVRTSLSHFRTATVGQDRTVELEVPDELPQILADRGALVDALVNLLTNAHKYSEKGRPILIRAWADKHHVHVSVQDFGVGIAHREHRRVFEKFYRSDDRLSRSIEGSGLGLSIVKHVAHAHGGQVTLKSTLGEGSTFTLSLPVHGPDSQVTPALSEGARASTADDLHEGEASARNRG